MITVTTVECTRCKFPTHLKIHEFNQFDIIYCKGCERYSIIVDSCLAHPEKTNTAGITKQVSFESWVMEKFHDLGLVQAYKHTIGTVIDSRFKTMLVNKYNSDHPTDMIK